MKRIYAGDTLEEAPNRVGESATTGSQWANAGMRVTNSHRVYYVDDPHTTRLLVHVFEQLTTRMSVADSMNSSAVNCKSYLWCYCVERTELYYSGVNKLFTHSAEQRVCWP